MPDCGMNILVISLAGIGDTLFATPLIHELRANYPDARIDAFVRWAGSKHLLDGNPHLNTVHHKDLVSSGKAEAWRFLMELRRQKYDLSLNTHPRAALPIAPSRVSSMRPCAPATNTIIRASGTDSSSTAP